ncbi:effector binding domain-containing protein [Clostridium hydrogeniformans]|uniref:effector binding domain-containing protein n=1 Tax=Clostridium hydrogeniformans TaxID=349933 RepID=UPI00241874D1|nr:effector binding domain-containing protein [Clostridium hydrogeniformans]
MKNRVNEMAIGLYTEYEGDFTKPYKFYAGVEVEEAQDLNEGLEVKTIHGGKYDCDFEVYHND